MAPSQGWQEGLTSPSTPSAALDSSPEFYNLILGVAIACACHWSQTHLAKRGPRLSINVEADASRRQVSYTQLWPSLGS